MAFPADPLPIGADLFYSGAWNPVTPGHVRGLGTEDGSVRIVRGGRAEGGAKQTTATLAFNNRNGLYSVRSPASPLYGLIGQNTPLRVYVGTPFPAAVESSLSPVTDLVAPSVDAPTNDGVLVCCWGVPANMAANTFTPPVGMTSLGGSAGINGLIAPLYQALTASGPTGTRTATLTTPEPYIATSVVLHGDSVTLAATDGYQELPTLQTDSFEVDVEAGQLLLCFGYFCYDDPDVAVPDFPATTEGGWWLLADSGDLQPAANGAGHTYHRLKTWARWVKASGPLRFAVVGDPADMLTLAQVSVWNNVGAFSFRLHAEVPAWPPKWDASGRDIWVPVQAAGILRRLGAGEDPLESAPHRYIVPRRPVGYWECNDADGSQGITAVVGQTMLPRVSIAPFGRRKALPRFGAQLDPHLPPGVETTTSVGGLGCNLGESVEGGFVVDWLVRAEPSSTADKPMFPSVIVLAGTLEFRTIVAGDSNQLLVGVINNTTETAVGSVAAPIGQLLDGATHHIRTVVATGSGTNATITTYVDGTQVGTGNVNIGVTPVPAATAVRFAWSSEAGFTVPVRVGQIVVWNLADAPAVADVLDAYRGHAGERAGRRFMRLSQEEGVPALVVGHPDATPKMGPQYPDAYTKQADEIATTDGGVIYEPREFLGLAFRPLSTRYNAPAAATLTFGPTGELVPPFHPVPDDQGTVNDITAGRRDGGSARVEKTSGPRNVHPPADDPEGVGRYKGSLDVNPATDQAVPSAAGWAVHEGTVGEERYSDIAVDLERVHAGGNVAQAEAIAHVDLTDRVVITDPPSNRVAPDPIDQVIAGLSETLNQKQWQLRAVTRPASPFRVAVLGDPILGRLDTGGSALAIGVDADDTTLLVAVDSGRALWNTSVGLPWTVHGVAQLTGVGLLLPGSSGAYASTPAAGVPITGDLDAAVDARLVNWRAGVAQTLVSRYVTTGNQRCWRFWINASNQLSLTWSTDGTATTTATSSTTLPWATFRRAARVTMQAASSSGGGRTVRFWIADHLSQAWTQSGATVTGASTSVFNSATAPLEVGSFELGTAERAAGTFYAVRVRNRFAGDALAYPMFNNPLLAGVTSFSDGTFPFNIRVGGEVMRVTGITGTSSPQTFTVVRGVNGITRAWPAGTRVQLSHSTAVPA